MSTIFTALLVFATVFLVGGTNTMAYPPTHLVAVIFALLNLKNISRTPIFWFLFIFSFFFSSEPRFSSEYILFAMTFFSFGGSKIWKSISEEKRVNALLIAFALFAIANELQYGTSERGAFMLWLPVFLAIYITKLNKKNVFVYLASGMALFFSNKKTALMAYIFSFKSKLFYLLATAAFFLSFFLNGNIQNFIEKSILPRLAYWQSTALGILDKPILGHGYGTFAIDFPVYRLEGSPLLGKANMIISHGHSQVMHNLFELGLVGALLLFILFYLVYRNAPRALLPLLIIFIIDTSFFSYNQMLLASLVLIPALKDPGIFKKIFKSINNKKGFYLNLFAYIIAIAIMVPSLIGHFYYQAGNYDKAIEWDPQHSFYYFMRGTYNLKVDTKKSEEDYKKAIALSPSVSYFYGFLAAAQLSNFKVEEAEKNIDKAIKYDGENGQWYYMKGAINYQDKNKRDLYIKKGLELSPEINYLLKNPEALKKHKQKYHLGQIAFFRKGASVFLPTPYPILKD